MLCFFLQELKQPSDNRIHVLAAAYKEGYSIEKLYELTKIDKWFLSRMKCIMDYALMLKSYREKAEVIRIFSIFVNLSEQNNFHLNVEGTMSYFGKILWNRYRKRPCISRTFLHKSQAKNQGCGLSMDTSVFGVLKNLINIHKTS